MSLFRKYRPHTFADVAEQAHVVRTLTQQIIQGSLAQVYLFSGPRGVGKTTIARLLAKSLQCTGRASNSAESCSTCPSCMSALQGKMMDTLEIDAASQTGVETVRENIIEGVRFGPALGKYKIFIIDEVHMLSTASFNALLKTLEEPPSFAIFILATTELHKIPATVLSRCQRFAFTRIPAPAMLTRLRFLSDAEGRTVDEEVLLRITRLSEGCLRDAESLLGQVFDSVEGHVDDARALTVLPDSSLALLNVLITFLAEGQIANAAREVRRASEAGASLRHVHDDMLEYVQELVLRAWNAPSSDQAYDEHTQKILNDAAKNIGALRAVQLLDALLAARERTTPAQLPELPLQIAFFTWGQTSRPDGASKQTVTPRDLQGEESCVPGVTPEAVSSQTSLREESGVPDLPPASLGETSAALAAQHQELSPVVAFKSSDADIAEKWQRCLEKAKEAGPGYGLMISSARFLRFEGERTVVISLPYQMHVEKMQDPKNAKILLDAIREVCLMPHLAELVVVREGEENGKAPQVETGVQDLLAAFGGSVI